MYGACFSIPSGEATRAVFAARPGSRVWRAKAADGTVETTFNLKQGLVMPSSVLLGSGGTPQPPGPSSANFAHLQMLTDRLLLTWHAGRVIVLDVVTATVCGWFGPFQAIRSVACCAGEDLFVLHEEGPVFTHLRLLGPGPAAQLLADKRQTAEAVAVLRSFFMAQPPRAFCQSTSQDQLQALLAVPDLAPPDRAVLQDMLTSCIPVYEQLAEEDRRSAGWP